MKINAVYQCQDGEVNGDGVLNGKHGISIGWPCCAKARLVPTPPLYSYGSDTVKKPG